MTGYGKNICELENKKITVEIRTLNSKGFDLNTRIPSIYKEKEICLRNEILNKLERGKIDFSIYVEHTGTDKCNIINKEVVSDYFKQLNTIVNEHKIQNSDILSTIMRLPDTLKTEIKELDETEWAKILKTIQKTIDDTNRYRTQEGEVLLADIISRINLIHNLLVEIEPFEKERINKIKKRIESNLFDVVSKESIDNNRLEQELIFYIEKIDITEEKTRLTNHCKYFTETAKKENAAGKKLGFISQEIGREINTIGSKANDYDIQNRVVQMKDELEKIKEQLLNIL